MNLDEMITTPPMSPIPITNIAFGKCLPKYLKQTRQQIDDCMKPNFPDELRTDEYLFKGIEGLRYKQCKTFKKGVNIIHQKNKQIFLLFPFIGLRKL